MRIGKNAGLRAPLRSHPAGGSLLHAPVRLYENHCVVCHTSKVHRRVPPLPLHIDELRFIVTLWASQQGLRWSRDDIEDVVHYLDRTHYRLDK